MMSSEKELHTPLWYVVQTKPQEEDRADYNLQAWNVETFAPRKRERRVNQFSGKPTYYNRALFPRYIFAKFDLEKMLHKVTYTRGVHKIISFNAQPVPVDDDAIAMLQSRVGKDGFINLEEEFLPGEDVIIKGGTLKGLNGVFDRSLKDSDRVRILLTTINYQAHITLEKELIGKADTRSGNA